LAKRLRYINPYFKYLKHWIGPTIKSTEPQEQGGKKPLKPGKFCKTELKNLNFCADPRHPSPFSSSLL